MSKEGKKGSPSCPAGSHLRRNDEIDGKKKNADKSCRGETGGGTRPQVGWKMKKRCFTRGREEYNIVGRQSVLNKFGPKKKRSGRDLKESVRGKGAENGRRQCVRTWKRGRELDQRTMKMVWKKRGEKRKEGRQRKNQETKFSSYNRARVEGWETETDVGEREEGTYRIESVTLQVNSKVSKIKTKSSKKKGLPRLKRTS